MPLYIIRNDITKMKVDAIVNAANSSLLGGGGVDGCIHRAAGPELLAECRTLGGCETGSAKITGAGKLSCKYVIHAVGPRWVDGSHGEKEKLTSCYRTALKLAKEHGCETVAFPLISSGIYGYPKDRALRVAVDTISDFLFENEMTVYIVIFDKKSYQISSRLYADIAEYIDDNYAEAALDKDRRRTVFVRSRRLQRDSDYNDYSDYSDCSEYSDYHDVDIAADAANEGAMCEPQACEGSWMGSPAAMSAAKEANNSMSLDEALSCIDESFSEMLLRKIDEKGMTDAECYKKANIDRKLFSKIRSDRLYKPSKPTAIAFAIALELTPEETKEMLMKAGFALSRSNKFDIIIEYFIRNGNYNIFEINEALFAFDQSLLGA